MIVILLGVVLHLVRRLTWPTVANLLCATAASKSIYEPVNSDIKRLESRWRKTRNAGTSPSP
jgi:hypothetical protein